MNRYLSRTFDLTGVGEKPILEFDLWCEIKGDYDYLYLEASTDGLNFQHGDLRDRMGRIEGTLDVVREFFVGTGRGTVA